MKQKIMIYLATQRIHEGAGLGGGKGLNWDGTGKISKHHHASLLFHAATVGDPQTLFITAGWARVHRPIYKTILLVPTILT
jgi:hypothetical protein